MDKLTTYSCVSYFIKWDKCIHQKDSKKLKQPLDTEDIDDANKEIGKTNEDEEENSSTTVVPNSISNFFTFAVLFVC